MSKAKWYNPTGDVCWDSYYKAWWMAVAAIVAFIAGVTIVGVL